LGQRAVILTQILGFHGWRVLDTWWEAPDGARVWSLGTNVLPPEVRLVLRVSRRWTARCPECGDLCPKKHCSEKTRRWSDLPWAGHPVSIEYAPVRVACRRCNATPVERLPWADPYQRETARLQQHLGLQAASMPIVRVAAQYGLSWSTVRRAEDYAIARWEVQRPKLDLRQIGIDEKYLGRRHSRPEKFVTLISNLETGEPVWFGYGRSEATVKQWLDTLTPQQKKRIQLFAMDMHEAFKNAIRNDPLLAHAPVVHDPFHVMKRANEALEELRRSVFFRAGAGMRALGRGARWLFLRAWERCSALQKLRLQQLLACNSRLTLAYQVKEELRGVLAAPNEVAMQQGLAHLLRRIQRKTNIPLRKLHDSLMNHRPEILAFGKYRPPVGRIEALNNNWETLVRRGRGYRDHQYLFRKLRFLCANPLQTEAGVRAFLALAI